MNLQAFAVVIDEAQLSEPVHEEANSRAGSAHHLCQSLLTNLRNHSLRRAFLTKVGKQQKDSGQPLFTRIEKLVNQIFFDGILPPLRKLLEQTFYSHRRRMFLAFLQIAQDARISELPTTVRRA